MFEKLRKALQKNKFTNKLMTNYDFRTIIFSLCSFAIGIAFAAYNIFVALVSRSIWYGALGIYYLFLDVVRAVVLYNEYKRGKKDDKHNGLKLYGICGLMLVLMTVFLNSIVVHLVSSNKVYEYSDTVIYMVAGYTFYRIVVAIYNVVKARKNDNYLVRSLRWINLVTAFVSFLSLQSAALYAYSRGTNHAVVNAITGCIVCILVAAIGIFMFVNMLIRLKKLKQSAIIDEEISVIDIKDSL